MADNVITVSGLPDLEKRIYSFSKKLGDYAVLRSLRYGGNIIKKAVSDAAPVYRGKEYKYVKSGVLKRGFRVVNSKYYSVKTNMGVLGVFVTLKAGTKGYKNKNDQGLKKDPNDPFYGIFLEGGTINYKGAKGFFDRAYEANKTKAADKIINSVEEAAAVLSIQENLNG